MLSAYQWWTYIIASHLVKSKLNKRQKKKTWIPRALMKIFFISFSLDRFV